MGVSDSSTVVGFDADAALEAVRDATGDAVRLCVEYTPEEFRVLYADELTTSLYGDADRMVEHFEEVHSYVHIDFTEQDLFAELFRGAGEVRSLVTFMDHVVLVRIIVDFEGLFFTLSPGSDVTAAVRAVEGELD